LQTAIEYVGHGENCKTCTRNQRTRNS